MLKKYSKYLLAKEEKKKKVIFIFKNIEIKN